MEKEQYVDMTFPLLGVDLTHSFDGQLPQTTQSGVNVRGCEPGTLRFRGGSRPGLSKFINEQLPLSYVSGSHLIQHLAVVVDPSGEAMLANYDDLPRDLYDPSSDGPPESWGFDPITFDPLTTRNLGFTFPEGGTGIQPRNGGKRALIIVWADPDDITLGTALSGTQLNAIAKDSKTFLTVPGSYAYTPASGTVLALGSARPLMVQFTPGDINAYSGGKKTVHINVVSPSPSLVQTAFGAGSNPEGTIQQGSFTSDVVGGNLLLVTVVSTALDEDLSVPEAPVQVLDSQGNVYTQIGSNLYDGVDTYSLWYAYASLSGGCAVTVTLSVANPLQQQQGGILLLEYSGVAASSPIDGSVTNKDLTDLASHWITGLVPVSGGQRTVVGIFIDSNISGAFTADAGLTMRVDASIVGHGTVFYVCDKHAVSVTTQAGMTTPSGTSFYYAFGISLKPVGA